MTEPTMIGVSPEDKEFLLSLKSQGIFAEALDAYRFAIGLAISRGMIAKKGSARETMYSVSSLDPSKEIYQIIEMLDLADSDEPMYRCAERLAEAGIKLIRGHIKAGKIMLSEIFM